MLGAHADAYRKAVELNPRDYRAWYGMGQTYELLQMPFYALHYYRRATQLRPQDARMWCANPPPVFIARKVTGLLRLHAACLCYTPPKAVSGCHDARPASREAVCTR